MDSPQEIPQNIIHDFVGAAHGDFEKVKALLEEYPGLLNARVAWDENAIEAATQMGRVDLIEYLLQQGAPMDICTASIMGQEGTVRQMVADDPGRVHVTGAHGIPLLYFPAIAGQEGIAVFLLSKGAEINAGAGGNTPLHGAVMFGQAGMVRWLLDHGADSRLTDYEQRTPLQLAQQSHQDEIIHILQERV